MLKVIWIIKEKNDRKITFFTSENENYKSTDSLIKNALNQAQKN